MGATEGHAVGLAPLKARAVRTTPTMSTAVPAMSLGSPQHPLVALSQIPTAGMARTGRRKRLTCFMALYTSVQPERDPAVGGDP